MELHIGEEALARQPSARLERGSHECTALRGAVDIGAEPAVEARRFGNTEQRQCDRPGRRPGDGALEAKRERQGTEGAGKDQLPEAVESSSSEAD
jgi:hypothetical protein